MNTQGQEALSSVIDRVVKQPRREQRHHVYKDLYKKEFDKVFEPCWKKMRADAGGDKLRKSAKMDLSNTVARKLYNEAGADVKAEIKEEVEKRYKEAKEEHEKLLSKVPESEEDCHW